MCAPAGLFFLAKMLAPFFLPFFFTLERKKRKVNYASSIKKTGLVLHQTERHLFLSGKCDKIIHMVHIVHS